LKRFILISFLGLTLGLIAPVSAQQHEPAAGDADELGEAAFATSCAPEVQGSFNRAVAMLHSFWYQVSERAFAEIAETDPSCAMAYWGIAMSRFRQLWETRSEEDVTVGQTALERARRVGAGTARERDYIRALDQFYGAASEAEFLDRKVAYEQAMEGLYRRYPDDREAAVFYALALLGTARFSPPDKTYDRQKRAGAILEEIFAAQPNHPGLAHYIIHSYDYPQLAGEALDAARRYANIAPDAPHALHMPSHIFTRLGLWQESIGSNREAAAAARRDQWTGQELHATDYLAYAYLQGAQDGEAERIVDEVPKQRERLKEDDTNYFSGLYATAAIPARFALERRQWKEAAALNVPVGVFPDGNACAADATLVFARGLGAARTGELPDARHSIRALELCRETLLQNSEDLWANRVEVQRRSVAAWVALAEGKKDDALALMRFAADLEDGSDKPPTTPGSIVPARELLGEMLLDVQLPPEALSAFEAALEDTPNRFRSLYGAARAAKLLGDVERARKYFSLLVDVSRQGDGERAELREAKEFLGS